MGEQWPTDPEFRRFAAKVADAVTVFTIKDNWLVVPKPVKGAEHRCCCPIGALVPGAAYPNGWIAGLKLGFNGWHVKMFTRGFDGEHFINSQQDGSEPYHRLGKAYREWSLARFKETT